jgi:hypothetical protein
MIAARRSGSETWHGKSLTASIPRSLVAVLRRIADYPASRLHELLPWSWEKPDTQAATA